MIVIALATFFALLGAFLHFAGTGKWALFGTAMFAAGLTAALVTSSGHQLVVR